MRKERSAQATTRSELCSANHGTPGLDYEIWKAQPGESETSRCSNLFAFTPRGMHPPRHANADHVQSQHRNRVDAHGPRVRAGADDRGDNKHRQDGIADVLPEESRA